MEVLYCCIYRNFKERVLFIQIFREKCYFNLKGEWLNGVIFFKKKKKKRNHSRCKSLACV